MSKPTEQELAALKLAHEILSAIEGFGVTYSNSVAKGMAVEWITDKLTPLMNNPEAKP